MRFLKLLIVLMPLIASTNAYTSTGAIGGTDNRRLPDYFAWYQNLSDKPQPAIVRFCTYFGDHVEVAEARVAAAVKDSFVVWRQYASRMSPETEQALNLEAKHEGTCDAATPVDLRVLVGLREGDPLFAKAYHYMPEYNNPAAFARLKNPENITSWNKGLLWVHAGNPYEFAFSFRNGMGPFQLNWTDPDTIEAVIRHEVGHIFGNGHYPGTIMAETYVDEIWQPSRSVYSKKEKKLLRKRMLNIDQEARLVNQNYINEVSHVPIVEISPDVVELLTGSRPDKPKLGRAEITLTGYNQQKPRRDQHTMEIWVAWTEQGRSRSMTLRSHMIVSQNYSELGAFVTCTHNRNATNEKDKFQCGGFLRTSLSMLASSPDHPEMGPALVVINGISGKGRHGLHEGRLLTIDFAYAREDKLLGRFGVRSVKGIGPISHVDGKEKWLLWE